MQAQRLCLAAMNKTHLTTHKFADFALAPQVLEALSAQGYQYCTPIQAQTLPLALAGKDIAGQAQTGTGKTLAFLTATFHYLLNHEPKGSGQPRDIIMAPTRELAAQIEEQIQKYGKELSPKLKHHVVFGGVSINPQMMALRGGVDILTATPGRLLDLVSQNAVKLDQVQMLVLDEADRMLDMGFIRDIKKILALLS